MPSEPQIPEVVIRRLTVYARALAFLESEGFSVVSSQELGRRLGVTPAQIRKDLSYFYEREPGDRSKSVGFGKQGTGYAVGPTLDRIRQILGLTREWPMVLVGVGRLGRAIVSYSGSVQQGFRVVAIFDEDPDLIGQTIDGLVVQPLDQLERTIAEKHVQIGIVAVPAGAGQRVIDILVRAGIGAILNYAPIAVRVPEWVRVRNVDPIVALQSMTYYLVQGEGGGATHPASLRDAADGLSES
ncbi:MAG TPA: redox-sensing transcriptional repressor Rex [Dehalococcoidia bacterium]|nr:redox-sensing transcriptional repressor Rex [Dehalococcoidia bacterium]